MMENTYLIKIDDREQLAALLEHYRAKGWEPHGNLSFQFVLSIWPVPSHIDYSDKFCCRNSIKPENFTIMAFQDFASIAGIEFKPNLLKLGHGITADVNANGVRFIFPAPIGEDFCLTAQSVEQIYQKLKSVILPVAV